jgi:hypothetical protein
MSSTSSLERVIRLSDGEIVADELNAAEVLS